MIQHRGQQGAGFWACDGKLCPSFGDGNKAQVPIRAIGLVDKVEVTHHEASRGSCGGQKKVVFAQARGGAIIQHMAIFAQHQAVANAADGQG